MSLGAHFFPSLGAASQHCVWWIDAFKRQNVAFYKWRVEGVIDQGDYINRWGEGNRPYHWSVPNLDGCYVFRLRLVS